MNKSTLTLILSAVFGLAGVGVAGYFLFSSDADVDVDERLEQPVAEEGLLSRDEAIRKANARLKGLRGDTSISHELQVYAPTVPVNPLASLPENLESYDTGAGRLFCSPGVCDVVTPHPAPGQPIGVAFRSFELRVKPEAAATAVNCAASAEEAHCDADGFRLASAGDHLVALGDGCVYAQRKKGQFFPLTLRFCLSAKTGQLQAEPSAVHAINLRAKATAELPLFNAPGAPTSFAAWPGGTWMSVETAVMEGITPKWYFVRNEESRVGWTPASALESAGPCSDSNKHQTFCFNER